MIPFLSTLAIVSGISSPSLAFAPSEDVWIGQQPTRTRRHHKQVQARLTQQASWQQFLDGEGAGWHARFDERTGTAHRAWGPPIDLGLGQDATEEDVSEALLAFFARNEILLGHSAKLLQPAQMGYFADGDTWYVHLDRVLPTTPRQGTSRGTSGDVQLGYDALDDGVPVIAGGLQVELDGVSVDAGSDGVPVWRGGIEARVVGGRLVLFGVDTYPAADLVGAEPVLSAATALEVAIEDGPAPAAVHTAQSVRLVVVPFEVGTHLDLTLCWEVTTRTTEPVGIWLSFVDATTGELRNVNNEIRFLTGSVYGIHDERSPTGAVQTSPMPYINVTGAGAVSTFTDADGTYSLSDDAPLTSSLGGTYVRVRNQAGDNGALSWDSGDGTWTEDDATQAEIDTYVFIHHVRDWAATYAPEVAMVDGHIRSNVNINSTCNAYYDGDVNFFERGGGCNNTGRIADVNYHEWGHGFHYYSIESGWYDDSLGEGAADVMAFLQTGDHVIGPYFYTGGGGIRDVEPDMVYPDDFVHDPNYIHYNGLIFGGAVWDLWGLLEDELGPDEAYETIAYLYKTALKGGPEIPDTYDEFVLADDDNGNLDDGTPHLCQIIDAFSLHGLGPVGEVEVVAMSHEPLDNQPAGLSEYPVAAIVGNTALDCVSIDVASARLYYSTDDGDNWNSVELADSDDTLSGAIPGQPVGTTVLYYLEALDSDDAAVLVPSGGEINPFSFYVGELVELYCEDFEDDDGGYTHELLEGRDEEGADDWMHGEPQGLGGDPDYAWSGSKVWGNDLGGGNYNGEYQANKTNRLSSPAIDTQGYSNLVIQFRRWLNVQDGYYDSARVTANDDQLWRNNYTSRSIGDEHHLDNQWALATSSYDVEEGVTELVLAWELQSDGSQEYGGWNIDDVCVYGVPTPAASDTGDTGSTGVDPADDGDEEGTCGCANARGTPFGATIGLLGLVALARRRRPAGPAARR